MKDAAVKVSNHTHNIWINICSPTNPAKLLLYALFRLAKPEYTHTEALNWEERIWKNISEQEVEMLLDKIKRDSSR